MRIRYRFPFHRNRSLSPTTLSKPLSHRSGAEPLNRLTSVYWPNDVIVGRTCATLRHRHLCPPYTAHCAQVSLDEPEVVVLIELVKEYSA